MMHPGADVSKSEIDVSGSPESRALVLIAPSASASAAPPRRNAQFVAHLIATRMQAPQTRLRRRAEPREAVRSYRAVASLV